MLTALAIKEQARALGFDVAGIAPAEDFPELRRLDDWLARGYAGEMQYLHRSADTRRDIRNFLPSARSVIVTGTIYYADPPEPAPAEEAGEGDRQDAAASSRRHSGEPHPIARYAWGDDYHDVLTERLEALVAWMREESGAPFDARIFVDKHHVQERVYARRAGLGWIGKNTCLINSDLGSWMFLAGVAVSLALEPDAPVPDACGACTLCIDACPTGALVDANELDARRCISYLTIEHKSEIPLDLRRFVGDHIFGCDICQDVCPYNLAPLATLDPAWQPAPDRVEATAASLWVRPDDALRGVVKGSAMVRASMSRLRRNLAVALGNSGDPDARAILDRPGGGVSNAAPSAETPLVQEHVAWARRALEESETLRTS